MTSNLILASRSEIRAELLRKAQVQFDTEDARVDEESIKQGLLAEGAHPRDIADKLAEAKARKVSGRNPSALVLGCDQVLSVGRNLYSKAESESEAIEQLRELRGKTHHLFSALVICEGGDPKWRHIGQARLTMRDASDAYIADYVSRNWESIQGSVGSYKLEEEGIRLMSKIDGDYFSILGLPLVELLSYLTFRGTVQE